MSTWTVPITWTVGQKPTKAQMDAEIRDHANFLKGAWTVATNGTEADTGDTMNLWIKRAAAANSAYSASVTADTNARFILAANGDMTWGTGAAVGDVTLKRSGVGILRIDNVLNIYNTGTNIALATTQAGDANYRFSVLADGTARWGDGAAAPDVTLSRDVANVLRLGENDVLRGYGSVATSGLLQMLVTGDAGLRLHVRADGVMEWGDGSASRDVVLQRAGANLLTVGTGDSFGVGATQIITARQTGWAAATNTKLRTTFDTTTVTLPNLAARVGALLDDLITHGLIGA